MYRALRIRTDFVRWLGLTWPRRLPGSSCYGLWVARTGPGGLYARRIVCPASVRTGDSEPRPGIDLPEGRQCESIES
jgi:hypothetical protein